MLSWAAKTTIADVLKLVKIQYFSVIDHPAC